MPEALLSDRGTNLLSHLMTDVCKLLGTKKLNTTAYHPVMGWCDGMVERFNHTLKAMLRKHADVFGSSGISFFLGCYRPIGIHLMILNCYSASIADHQKKLPISNPLTFTLWTMTITGKSYKYQLLLLRS